MTLIAVRELEIPDLPLSTQRELAEQLSIVEAAFRRIEAREAVAAEYGRRIRNSILEQGSAV